MRAETGPMQFGDDWTGYFIRGDNAFGMAMNLKQFMANPESPFFRQIVENWLDALVNDVFHGNHDRPTPQRMKPFEQAKSNGPSDARGVIQCLIDEAKQEPYPETVTQLAYLRGLQAALEAIE